MNSLLKKAVRALINPEIRATHIQRIKARLTVKYRIFFNPHPLKIKLNEKTIGLNSPVFIIAEIGINHNGNINIAKKLIEAAANAGADAIKLQIRDLSATYTKDVVDAPELYEQSFQYLIPILKEFKFEETEYKELKEYSTKKGLIFFASAFDESSVDFIERVINPPLYKIASADLINIPLIEKVLKLKKPLILSTGMSTLDEIDHTVSFLHKCRAVFALLHCHSTYPASIYNLNLSMMHKLKNRYQVPVGYSGHELEIFPTLYAVAMGAKIVERHITLDRNMPGPDHNASLEPEEFKELVKRIREFEISFGVPIKQISRGEVANRLTLRKSVVAAVDIPKGVRMTRLMLTSKSPGSGLSPQRIYELVGKPAPRNFKKDDIFMNEDLKIVLTTPEKIPNLKSNWGLKTRFAELKDISRFRPSPVFYEFHMSDEDMNFKFDTSQKFDQELYVHAPEYWKKDLIDLASEDKRICDQSIDIIQRAIDKTEEIKNSFNGTPKIIIHIGGYSINPNKNPKKLLSIAKESFKRLNSKGMILMPENLPPFGWFFGGLWNCNIFTRTEDMVEFCNELKLQMCLDLSHAWLYTAHAEIDYIEYIKSLAPYTTHLHLADGRGAHKEGIQIGEGDIPFKEAFEILEKYLPNGKNTSWVPEIWQGYLHDYAGFKTAVIKLAKYDFIK